MQPIYRPIFSSRGVIRGPCPSKSIPR
jgi:hypothetical protein